ncbi:hypothetical protein B0T13DRAFT_224203 [Neurospora crassa]|nr:hypothetical protein B0T13DRAFT_224203 [Neurospora crassa]
MSEAIDHPLQRRNAFRRVPKIPRQHLSSGFAYLPESLQVNRLNHPVPQGTTTSTTPSNISTSSQAESSGPSVPSIPSVSSDPSSSSTEVHIPSDASGSHDSHHVSTTPRRFSWVTDDYVSDLDSDEENDPIMAPRRSVSPDVSSEGSLSDSDMDQILNVPPNSPSDDTTWDMDYYSPCWHCSDSHYGKCEAQKAYEELARKYWEGNGNVEEQLRQTDTRDFAAEAIANGRAGQGAAALRAGVRISRFIEGKESVMGPAKPLRPLESLKIRKKKTSSKWKGKEKVEGAGRDFLEGRLNMNGELVGNARGSDVAERKPKTETKKGERRLVERFFGELVTIAASFGCGFIGSHW